MLSADFGNLERDTKMIDGSRAEWLHFDVMDGVFVPNISFGFPVLEAIVRSSTKFIDTHLMIVEPEKYVERFVRAGSDMVTFHVEATADPVRCIELIHGAGAKAGVSLKPATSVEDIEHLLPLLDMVLVMSVEPGFGGQKFIDASLDKVRKLKKIVTEQGLDMLIEIDGGVSSANSAMLFEAGCDVLVAGSAVFKAENPHQEIINMLENNR